MRQFAKRYVENEKIDFSRRLPCVDSNFSVNFNIFHKITVENVENRETYTFAHRPASHRGRGLGTVFGGRQDIVDGPVRRAGARSGQAERRGDPLARQRELAPTERSVERRPVESAHLRESVESEGSLSVVPLFHGFWPFGHEVWAVFGAEGPLCAILLPLTLSAFK